MTTANESPPVPKLGLADLAEGELPALEAIVRNAKHDIVANVGAQIVALIVSPQNRILYSESICTSDAGAHALMGCFSDPRGAVELRFNRPGAGDYIEIQPPEVPRLANVRLAVPGWSRNLHHVAMLDRSGELMLAPDDATLWRKLQEKMSCPSLGEWGDVLMRTIYHSGMLLECDAFGAPEGLRAFVLASNAQETFDRIVSEHVRVAGIRHETAA